MHMVHNTNPVADKSKSYMYISIELIWPWKWPSFLYWSYNFDLDIYNQQTLENENLKILTKITKRKLCNIISAIHSSPRIKLLWRVTELILTSIGYIGWNDIRWEKVVPSPWESGALHHQGWVIEGRDCLLHWVQGSWSIEASWLLPGQTNHARVRTEELGLIQASWDWNI